MIKTFLMDTFMCRHVECSKPELKLMKDLDKIIAESSDEMHQIIDEIAKINDTLNFYEIQSALWYGFCFAFAIINEQEEAKQQIKKINMDVKRNETMIT